MRTSDAFFASILLLLSATLLSCQSSRSAKAESTGATPSSGYAETPPQEIRAYKVIHVLVALCDNVNQGIVPVPARLGNGDQPSTNLYWGAAFGIKTFFLKSPEWKLIESQPNPGAGILERCVFKHRTREIYMIADAYRGAEIRRTIYDLADFAAGVRETSALVKTNGIELKIIAGGGADLLVYVGHDGLMDFSLTSLPHARDTKRRNVMILCCASKYYFSNALRTANADPLLWTNGLMAPEAYILKAALDGWMINENGEKIRLRAAEAYNKYQRCGLKAARGLFATGF